MVALGLGGPHLARRCGVEEGQPLRSLQLPLAGGGLSPAGGGAGRGRRTGGRERWSSPKQPGKAVRGTRVVFKVSRNPSAAAAAGGAARSFLGLWLVCVSSRRSLLLGALTLLWPPRHPVGSALGVAGVGRGAGEPCVSQARGRQGWAGPGHAGAATTQALHRPPGRRPGPPGFSRRQHQRLAQGGQSSAEPGPASSPLDLLQVRREGCREPMSVVSYLRFS